MAVVAPDFAGLGFDKLPSGQRIGHPWINGPAQANDLANAVIAARKASPTYLSAEGPFFALGHSEGAAATWAFAERLVNKPIAGNQGTVAIAPPTRIIDMLAEILANPAHAEAPALLGQQPAFIAAVTASFPACSFSGMTPLSYDRRINVLTPLSGCLPTTSLVFADVSIDQLAQPGWTMHPTVQKYGELAESGRKKFKGPLLVLAGAKDEVVSLTSIHSAVNDTCTMLKQNG